MQVYATRQDDSDIVAGRYTLEGRLGEGGMGQVYRARHLQLGKAFALKIISPAFAGDSAARARFNQEAKLASEISHPNIVSVVDFGEDAHIGAYMVMELVEGEPLVGKCGQPMSVRRACEVLSQLADALDHIHKRGIVHGDVKAENIVLAIEPSGTRRRQIARLLDFGLACRLHDDHDGRISGSPHYLAPERATGGPATERTDVYALGVLGYLLLTGRLPFQGSVMEVLSAQVHEQPPAMVLQRGEVLDPALEALIARALAKDPAVRHPTAAAFRYELNTVMHMLDMQPRKRRTSQPMRAQNPHADAMGAAFERSQLPQALVSCEGDVVVANAAFYRLAAREDLDGVALRTTALAALVPDLVKSVRRVHVAGQPVERRGDGVTVWLSPLPLEGAEVHLIVLVNGV